VMTLADAGDMAGINPGRLKPRRPERQ
jgi:hypothetical protein